MQDYALSALRSAFPRRRLIDSANVREVECALQRLTHDDSVRLHRPEDQPGYRARFTGHCLDWVQILGIESTARVHWEVTPQQLQIIIPLAGWVAFRTAARIETAMCGAAYLVPPRATYRMLCGDGASGLVLCFPGESVRQTLAAGEDAVPAAGPLAYDGVYPSPETRTSWLLALASILADLESERSLLRSGVTRAAWRELLLHMLIALPASGARAQTPASTAPRHLRRAVEYAFEHLDSELSLADLAHASGAAPRTLTKWFRICYGVGPMTFVRNARLERVREELQRAHPCADTVADVAARWGFHDPSRFSRLYRRRFGELPSITLRGR